MSALSRNVWDTVSNPGVVFSAGAATNNLTAVTFSNSNGVSFGLNAGVITASAVGGTGGAGSLSISDNATSLVVSQLAFTNSNGITMTLSTVPGAATLIASYTVPTVTNSSWTVSDAVTSATVGRLAFTNSNGLTLSLITSNNGNHTVVGSYTVPTVTNSSWTVSDSATSATVARLAFVNTNGVSFALTTSNNGSQSVGATVATNYAGQGFTTATTAGTNVVGTLSTNGLSLGVPAFLTTATASAAIEFSAGNTSNNLGTIVFSNSNRLSFGLGAGANSTIMTAIAKVQFADNVTVMQANAVAFNNSNGVTFGLDTAGSFYTATVATNYAGQGFTTATTAGTAIVGTLSTNGLSMGVPAFLTAASGGGGVAISNSQTLFTSGTVALSEGGGAITIASSAGGQSLMFSVPQTSSLVGTNGISISTSGSTISVSNLGVTLSDSATSATVGRLAFVNTNGVSFAMSTSNNGQQTISASVVTNYLTGALGLNTLVATIAGTDLAMTGNSSGVTLGYPKWITTAALSSAAKSYFENMPILEPGSTTLSASGSVIQVCPFVLHDFLSVAFMRIPVSMSYVSTEASGTTANTTYTVNVSYTDAAVIYVQNNGASSLSLKSLTSGSATWLFQNQIQAGAQGSRYTVTQNVSYPISGTTSNYTTSYPQSSANVQISSASMTLFTGPRWLDIPMAISLSAGNYWLGLGRSAATATQAGNAALGGASAGFSYIGASQNNLTICFPGAVTNSSCQLQPGLGSWSTNAALFSTASLQLASISAMSSGPKVYFQMLRYA